MNAYYKYMNENVYYRSLSEMCEVFKKYGCDIESIKLTGKNSKYRFGKNGFPQGAIMLYASKRA
jgi:hypothetical protein